MAPKIETFKHHQKVPYLGTVITYYERANGKPSKVYIEIQKSKYSNYPVDTLPDYGRLPAIEFPKEAKAETPFNHVFMMLNPYGHPIFDGFGGGYGVKHIDIHFFTVPSKVRETFACKGNTNQGSHTCPNDPVLDKVDQVFFDAPAARKIPSGFRPDANAISKVGVHWAPSKELDYFIKGMTYENPKYNLQITYGPKGLDIIKVPFTAPNPMDCNNQGLASGEFKHFIKHSVDAGCRIPYWIDSPYKGVSPILVTYDRHLVATEVMPSVAFLNAGKDIRRPFPQPATEWGWTNSKFKKLGPKFYFVDIDTKHDKVMIGFELGMI